MVLESVRQFADMDAQLPATDPTASGSRAAAKKQSSTHAAEQARSAREAENIASFERFASEIWTHGSLALIEEMLSPQCLVHLPAGDLHGREAFREHFESSRRAFSEIQLRFDDLMAEDDRVVARWTLDMTHTGELQGTEPTGRRVELAGITIARFCAGRIFETWECWNMLDLLGQIGALPSFDGDEEE
ncbi:MAG: ester cyclase [Holophagales bacterium]|nr:ester cyclase [Holophagales bacterium]